MTNNFLSQCKRPDRDDFVTVDDQQLAAYCESEFKKASVTPYRNNSKGLSFSINSLLDEFYYRVRAMKLLLFEFLTISIRGSQAKPDLVFIGNDRLV